MKFNCELCNEGFDCPHCATEHIEIEHYEEDDDIYFRINAQFSHQLLGLTKAQSDRRLAEYENELVRQLRQ